MASIYLIRHGQASAGSADYDRLSATGVEQARVLGAALRQRLGDVDVVCSGTLRRHRDTARHCLQSMGLATGPIVDPGWNEFDHIDILRGYDDGLRSQADLVRRAAMADNPRAEARRTFAAAIARWVGGDHDGYRESWPAFGARVEQALAGLLAGLGRGQHALVFTSGGVISLLCGRLLGANDADILRLNMGLANASVSKLLLGRSGPRLSTLNEHGHFEGEQVHLRTYI